MRKTDGRETWNNLSNWDKGQASSERLAAVLLKSDGYLSVDPSHPSGGKDGGKDIKVKKDGVSLVVAVYFPRGQKSFLDIKNKFSEDLLGVEKNSASGIVFFTNQEIKLAERRQLENLVPPEKIVDIYHIERIGTLLNTPENYGVRQEFLQIDMTSSELVALYSQRDKQHLSQLTEISTKLDAALREIESYATGGNSYLLFTITNLKSDGNLSLVSTVRGNFPVFDVKIEFRYANSVTSTCDESSGADEATKTFIYPMPLTNLYPQLIGTIEPPVDFPAKISIRTYTRNARFDQSATLKKHDDDSYTVEEITVYRKDNMGESLCYEGKTFPIS